MTYQKWADEEALKKTAIITKLKDQGKSTIDIVNYFDFDNMAIHEPDYCGLYASKSKCHEMENLNCFFCGCPYFEFDDNGLEQKDEKTIYSVCSINAVKGGQFISDDAIHHDCTKCEIPHKQKFVISNIEKYM